MIPNLPTLGIRFDIDKLNSAAYGRRAWQIFWKAVDIEEIKGPHTIYLYEGDTAATLNGQENVYCLAFQTSGAGLFEKMRSLLMNSQEFKKAASLPAFVEPPHVLREPLMNAGHVDGQGRITGEEGMNPRASLQEVLQEQGRDVSFLDETEPGSSSSSALAEEIFQALQRGPEIPKELFPKLIGSSVEISQSLAREVQWKVDSLLEPYPTKESAKAALQVGMNAFLLSAKIVADKPPSLSTEEVIKRCEPWKKVGDHITKRVELHLKGFSSLPATSKAAICDVCSGPTNFQESVRFSAGDFRSTVERGFEPPDRVLSALAQSSGLSKEAALENWKTGLVAPSNTDWLLCPECNVKTLPYSPWKIEEKAVLIGCLVIALVGGYFLFGKAYSVAKNIFFNPLSQAQAPDATPEKLKDLAKSDRKYVREAVARHSNTSAETLKELSRDKEAMVREAVAKNPRTPPEILIFLSADKNILVSGAAFKNPKTPSRYKSPPEKKRLARDPNTPEKILRELAKGLDKYTIQRALDQNPKAPLELKSTDIKIQMAKNPDTSVKLLEKLARDQSYLVRWKVAENFQCTESLLEKLAGDKNPTVYGAALRHLKMTPEILERLANHRDPYVRNEVAKHRKTPEKTLEKLSEDKASFVPYAVALNPSTPSQTLVRLLQKNPGTAMKRNIAHNPNTPREILERLARDRNWEVKYHAKKTLEKLKK